MLWTTSDHTLSLPPPKIVYVTFLTEPHPRNTSILDRPGTFCYANNIPQLKTLPSVNAVSVFTKRSYVNMENILMKFFPSNLSVKGREWIAGMMQPPRGKVFLFTYFFYFFLNWSIIALQYMLTSAIEQRESAIVYIYPLLLELLPTHLILPF